MQHSITDQRGQNIFASTGQGAMSHLGSSGLVSVRDDPEAHMRGSPYDAPTVQTGTDASLTADSKSNTFVDHSNHARRAPGTQIFSNVPAYYYVLPAQPPLNFTLPEIIAILPHWFKKFNVAYRFENNGLTTAVHWAILIEHRNLNISLAEAARYKELITSHHRRALRSRIPDWTKSRHRVPKDWSTRSLGIEGFVPDVTRPKGHWRTSSVPLVSLAEGLRKLPEGPDAGDLTRVVRFALENKKVGPLGSQVDYLFPDDIYTVLDLVGRTVVTMDHIDTLAILRYGGTGVRSPMQKYRISTQATSDSSPDTSVVPIVGERELSPRQQDILQTAFQEVKGQIKDSTSDLQRATDYLRAHNMDKSLACLLAQSHFDIRRLGLFDDRQQKLSIPVSDYLDYSQDILKRGVVDFPAVPDVCLIPEDSNDQSARQPEMSSYAVPPTLATIEDMDALLAVHYGYVSQDLLFPPEDA